MTMPVGTVPETWNTKCDHCSKRRKPLDIPTTQAYYFFLTLDRDPKLEEPLQGSYAGTGKSPPQ